MKTQDMFRRVLTVLGLAAALALAPAPGRAQSNNAPPTVREDPRRAAQAQPAAPAAYDLDIENSMLRLGDRAKELAKLASVVKLLREKHPEANIALAPELDEVVTADLKLHGADLKGQLEALRVACGGKFNWKGGLFGGNNSPPLYILEPSAEFLRESTVPRPTQVEAFNMTSYFARQANAPTNEAALTAYKERILDDAKVIIKRTAELACGPSGAIEMQFYPGANLVVVVGTPDSLEVARKIIHAMMEEPNVGSLPLYTYRYAMPNAGVGGSFADILGNTVGQLNPDGSIAAAGNARALQDAANKLAAMQSNLVTPEVLRRLQQRRDAEELGQLPAEIASLQKQIAEELPAQIAEMQKQITQLQKQKAALMDKLHGLTNGPSGAKP